MTTFYSDIRANTLSVPPVRVKANKLGGRLRFIEATYTAPATGTPQIGDVIQFARLSTGARIVPHLSRLDFSAGTASSTLAIGDAVTSNRYLAATSIASAGNAALTTPSNAAASYETTDVSLTSTDDGHIIGTVAGAAVAANQVITLRLAYTLD